jgi:hypothetical protein
MPLLLMVPAVGFLAMSLMFYTGILENRS